VRGTYTKYRSGDDAVRKAQDLPEAQSSALRSPRRRGSGTGGRIAAASIGVAAMVGLVANMEITSSKAEATKAAAPGVASTQPVAQTARKAAAPVKVAEAKVRRPIVLTPHTVVHTVSAPSSGAGSGGGSTYSAPAPAPVASTGGS
jgi:hypothetical protein